MSALIVALAYVCFLGGGFFAPFVFSLGYVWVDAFGPQYVGREVLGGYPVSAIIAIASFMGYVLLDRRAPPRIGLGIILMGLMAVWMTLTMEWAVRPESAWRKWDWAFNAVVFAAFMPFVIRTRVQIEAVLQIFLLGSGLHLIGMGIKSAITGGGYNQHVTLLPPDTGLAESSAMATVAIMAIPLLFVLRNHSLLLPFPKLRTLFYIGFGITCLTATIGTGARTGLVCLAVLAVLVWQRSKHKVVAAVMVVLVGALLFAFAPQRWHSRMSTIDDFKQETSALTRIKIWQWSLEFVRDHPLGGGFRAYEVSVIHMPPDAFNPEGWVQYGRAPHSTWFEVLTELGYPGTIMFVLLIGLTFLTLWRTRRRTRGIEDLAWAHDMSLALIHALILLMAGATFIGIGFKPWFWLIFSVSFALSECVRRCFAEPAKVARFVPAASAPTPARGLAARGMLGRGRA